MKLEEVLDVYDRQYADTYDERFLQAKHARTAFENEVNLVKSLLKPGASWLDVACGTGRLLSRFPGVKRVGLDISPAMLKRARKANPDAFFREGDFRAPVPEWDNSFTLVTCMWYAYGLVETISDIERVVRNMAHWTSDEGTCFLPVWDPQNLSRSIRIPYLNRDRFYGGNVHITGLIWTWVEESGKKHENMVAPHLDHMVAMFEAHFQKVAVISYPLSNRWLAPKRKAIKATRKSTC